MSSLLCYIEYMAIFFLQILFLRNDGSPYFRAFKNKYELTYLCLQPSESNDVLNIFLIFLLEKYGVAFLFGLIGYLKFVRIIFFINFVYLLFVV